MNQHKLPLITAVVIALAAGFWAGDIFIENDLPEQAPPSHVMLLEVPQKLAIPALQQANETKFDIDSLSGKWSILFFGYTNCPDVCPATLNTLAQAKKEYVRQHLQTSDTGFPQVVFISVDPERDNADLLAQYVQYFDQDFIGVTAEEKLLRAITLQTYSNFISEPAQENGRYLVNHTVNLVLVNPDAEMVAVLSPPHSVASILEALSKFEL